MPRPTVSPDEEARRRELYDKGFNDREIARDRGVDLTTIAYWRRQRGLSTKHPYGFNKRRNPKTAEMTAELKSTSFALLQKGVSARTISRTFGLAEKTLDHYRTLILQQHPELRRTTKGRRNKIVFPSGRAYSKMRLDRRRQAFILYAKGASDGAIAEQIGVDRRAISEWRHAFQLVANFIPGQNATSRASTKTKQKRRPLPTPISPFSNPTYARIANAVGRSLAPDMRDDAISELMLALLEGRVDEDGLDRAATTFRNRVMRDCADKRFRSLDEQLVQDGSFTLMDRLCDERSSTWLEDAGATFW